MSNSLYEVFTPSVPAKKAFIEREAIQNKLVNALMTPGKQLVIYGHSGVGKTTLMNHKIFQTYSSHITTRCMKGMKFEQLLLDAFSKLEIYYSTELTKTKSNSYTICGEVSNLFSQIKAQISTTIKKDESNKQAILVPPQLTGPTLGKFLGEIKACWILEDFHKMDVSEKSYLSQLMKVFMDLGNDYPELKIIAIGAVDTARQVVEYDSEMKNRVFELSVPLMTDDEIIQIINKGSNLLNLNFSDDLKKEIVQHSAGMASVCHDLCVHLCQNSGIFETSDEKVTFGIKEWKSALLSYLEAASDKIQSAFEKALRQDRRNKFAHEKIIIESLCDFPRGEAARFDIETKILRNHKDYPKSGLKNKLEKLCSPEKGSILRYNEYSGTYCFADPIYHAYALAHRKAIFESSNNSAIPPEHEAFLEAIKKLLSMPKSHIVIKSLSPNINHEY